MKNTCAILLIGYFCRQTASEEVTYNVNFPPRYIVNTPEDNWFGAYRQCRLFEMDLVSIHSEKENEDINKLIQDDDIGYWTSGSDYRELEKKFEWLGTGLAINYTNWKDGFPLYAGDHCMAYLYSGKWINTYCYNKKRFICEDRTGTNTVSNSDNIVIVKLMENIQSKLDRTKELIN